MAKLERMVNSVLVLAAFPLFVGMRMQTSIAVVPAMPVPVIVAVVLGLGFVLSATTDVGGFGL